MQESSATVDVFLEFQIHFRHIQATTQSGGGEEDDMKIIVSMGPFTYKNVWNHMNPTFKFVYM